MSDKYILAADGRTAVPATDLMAWARWFESADKERQVASTHVGPSRVSTVFLGLDHFGAPGHPKIFETLVFDGPCDGEMERYSTWEEAEAGHAAMVERVKAVETASFSGIDCR